MKLNILGQIRHELNGMIVDFFSQHDDSIHFKVRFPNAYEVIVTRYPPVGMEEPHYSMTYVYGSGGYFAEIVGFDSCCESEFIETLRPIAEMKLGTVRV